MTQGEQFPRILVVTGEPDVGGHIQDSLTRHGCAVTIAATGQDALRQAGSADHDLIVLDAALPDSDGLEVYHSYRASGDSTPVVLLADPGPDVEGAEGVDDYVTKPFSAEALAARVLAVLGQADRAGGSDPGATPGCMPGTWNSTSHAGPCTGRAASGTQSHRVPAAMYLMSNQGRMLTREQILENVWATPGGPRSLIRT